MELTGKLKEQIEKAETREEAKKVIEEAGISLTDEGLEKVAGGGNDGLFWIKMPVQQGGNISCMICYCWKYKEDQIKQMEVRP